MGATLVKRTASGEFDCAAGISVQILDGDTVLGEAVSDAFGDVKIDGVVRLQTPRKLTVVVNGPQRVVRDIEMSQSVYIGRIELPAA